MDSEEQLIPVTKCDKCDKIVPVIIDAIDAIPNVPKILQGKGLEVVICPLCYSILNNGEDDIEIEWYDPKELEKVGYELLDDD